MALLSWRVVHDGKTPPPGAVVRADERLSWPRTVGLGAQHVVVTVAAFHLVRLLAPPHLREDQRLEGTGRPRGGGEGAAIIIDEPGAYKEP